MSLFMSKDAKEAFEEICKNEKVRKFVFGKTLLSTLLTICLTVYGVKIMQEDKILGILCIVLFLMYSIEGIVELFKLKRAK